MIRPHKFCTVSQYMFKIHPVPTTYLIKSIIKIWHHNEESKIVCQNFISDMSTRICIENINQICTENNNQVNILGRTEGKYFGPGRRKIFWAGPKENMLGQVEGKYFGAGRRKIILRRAERKYIKAEMDGCKTKCNYTNTFTHTINTC